MEQDTNPWASINTTLEKNKTNSNRLIILDFLTSLVGFTYQGKDIVSRFIPEYSSLGDFGP
jgi:hypothetical protein